MWMCREGRGEGWLGVSRRDFSSRGRVCRIVVVRWRSVEGGGMFVGGRVDVGGMGVGDGLGFVFGVLRVVGEGMDGC